MEIADFSSPVASSNGDSVAFRVEQASIGRDTYDSWWYVQPLDGSSPPKRVADGGPPLRNSAGVSLPATVAWSPDGQWIYYRALLDGKIDVWRAATDGSGASPLTRGAGDVSEFVLDASGRVLRYRVSMPREEVRLAEQAEYEGGIHIEPHIPLGQNLYRSGHIEGRPATQRLGTMFNRVGLMDGVSDRWKAVDTAIGSQWDLEQAEESLATPPNAGLPNEVGEVWKSASDPGGGRTAILRRTGERAGQWNQPFVELLVVENGRPRKPVVCAAVECTRKDITGVQWRPDSDEVVFTVTEASAGYAQSMFRWNVVTDLVLPVLLDDGMLAGEDRWGPGTCAISHDALACVTAGANRPPRLERIGLDAGRRRTLFDPNASLAQELADIPVELLRWSDAHGQEHTGQLYSAEGLERMMPPLFVTYYRCHGFVRGGSGDEWPLAALAKSGITTLCINRAPTRVDAVERYEQGRAAVESAIDLLSGSQRVDGSRVGMGGLSFGGEVTMWTLVHSDALRAASIASPVISHQYYLLGSNKGDEFRSVMREVWQLDGPDLSLDRWRQMSPALNLDRINAPLLMQFPEQELMHSLDYAIPLMRDLRAETYVFPGEPHIKFMPRHKLAAYQRNLDWFRFWLLDVEDSDPAKSEQYARWRAMRARFDNGGRQEVP